MITVANMTRHQQSKACLLQCLGLAQVILMPQSDKKDDDDGDGGDDGDGDNNNDGVDDDDDSDGDDVTVHAAV